jgi:hypothetical protein
MKVKLGRTGFLNTERTFIEHREFILKHFAMLVCTIISNYN